MNLFERKPINVLCVTSSNKYISELNSNLNQLEGIKSCLCKNPDTIEERVQKHKPKIIFSEPFGKEFSAVDLAKNIYLQKLPSKLVIYGDRVYENYLLAAFSYGLSGYILTNTSCDKILNVVENVSNGRTYFDPDASDILLRENIKASEAVNSDDFDLLTPRETEVLKLLVAGNSNKEVAEKLFISARTVETHRARIMKKLNVQKFSQLVQVAIEMGLPTK